MLREDFKSVAKDKEAVASKIAAAARSLQTNLILLSLVVVVVIVLVMAKYSDTIIVLAVSTF